MEHTDHKKLQRFLRENNPSTCFEQLTSLLPDIAVFVVDQDRNVVLWSEGAERILQIPASEAVGSHCLKSNRCANCMIGCGIQEFGAVRGVPLVLYRADGQPVSLRKHAHGFFDKDGEFLGGIEVLLPDHAAEVPQVSPIPPETVRFHQMLSRSATMIRAFELVRNVAKSDVTVLIRGESGTGKELIVRALHEESERRKGPMVAVNCAAFTTALLETELFGHVRGAFTGAVSAREGLFARADGGTLFLDEVAELPLELQSKLLRVLQERSFVPVGGSRSQKVDVRIVSATNRSLRQMVKEGTFREDLLYRLRVVPLFLPPLRERREDIEVLLWYFIEERNQQGRRILRQISPEAMQALLNYEWPGNIRELQNVVDYVFAVGSGPDLLLEHLPPEVQASLVQAPTLQASVVANSVAMNPTPSIAATTHLASESDNSESFVQRPLLSEEERIQWALRQTEGNYGEAAKLLGISRVSLWRKRKQYDL